MVLIIMITSYVTASIYSSAAAAEVIVEDVRGQEKMQEPQQEKKQDKESWCYRELKRLRWRPTQASAQIDVDTMAPEISAFKQSMKERLLQLTACFDKGAIGENNNGYTKTKDTAVLNLREKSYVTRSTAQGNQDRKSPYSEIVKANNHCLEVVPQVQKIFSTAVEESPSPAGGVKMKVVSGKRGKNRGVLLCLN